MDSKEASELALLARLALAPDELATLQDELGTILAHFERIAAVDTTDVPPMTHAIGGDMKLRADVPEASLPAGEALHGAPKREGDLFVVPAIISPLGDGDA